MFDNIGGKIKGLAKIVCYFGIAMSVITGIIVFSVFAAQDDAELVGIGFLVSAIIIGFGILVSWLSTILLYGYGQLIENSDILVESSAKAKKIKQKILEDALGNKEGFGEGDDSYSQEEFERDLEELAKQNELDSTN